jgi:uncharacterized protein with von Willebrand factor type A (vWA) domain
VKGRLEEELGEHIEVTGEYERYISNKMLPQDIEECLEEYIQQGDIDIEKGQIRITPKGGRKLANRIKLKFEELPKKRMGTHKIKELSYGLDLATTSKKYEPGDAYQSINILKSLLNSLERNALECNPSRISLHREDLQVYEKTYETRMCVGLIIDESGSMGEDKRNAAIDTCLALAKLKKANDKLKVFVYSAQVKEVPYWDVLNISLPGGTTDIRVALQAARRALSHEKGDKQVYLITDAETNTENGKYVGFEAAIPGVRKEAWRYRQEDITLNIVMLDEKAKPKELASHLAKINAGRVFLTSASNLGRVVIEDYLSARRSVSATR